jgi:integrase
MPRLAKGISAITVKTAKPGRYGDGGGLYLSVRSPTSKFWTFRFVKAGRMQEMGLGSAVGRDAISLADARVKARVLWDIKKEGRDPLAEKRAGRASAIHADGAKRRTFETAAEEYLTVFRNEWKNLEHARQWETTLRDDTYPIIGKLAVTDITTVDVLKVLNPIWNSKRVTANRLRARIESVLNKEKADGNRTGDNPAAWEIIKFSLPKGAKVKHHPAMPYKDIGSFFVKLREDKDTIARALEFTILNASRRNEVLHAKWSEIDPDEKLWIVPAARMKADREHRVALSARAIAILQEMERYRSDRSGDFVFPGYIEGNPLSPSVMLKKLRDLGCTFTLHGFRSTFRDWVSETTTIPGEVAELALAHNVGDETERSYRRGTMFAKRLDLAEQWSQFCSTPPPTKSDGDSKNVVPMRKKARA